MNTGIPSLKTTSPIKILTSISVNKIGSPPSWPRTIKMYGLFLPLPVNNFLTLISPVISLILNNPIKNENTYLGIYYIIIQFFSSYGKYTLTNQNFRIR